MILIGTLLVMAAGLILGWPRGAREPVYDGKRLSQWIEEAIPDASSKDCLPACNAIRSIGTNAVPYLMSEFIRPETKWQATFNRWASKHPTIRFRFSDYQTRFVTAAYGLKILGHDAVPALPTLANYLGDGLRGRHAAVAMGSAGDLAVPYLLKAIGSTNIGAAYNAGTGLAYEMRDSAAAIPALIQLLKHTNHTTRKVAAWILGAVHSQAEPIVPALTMVLSDPDPRVQVEAVHALAQKRKAAMSAVPALQSLMTKTNQALAAAASNAVQLIAPAPLLPRGPEP